MLTFSRDGGQAARPSDGGLAPPPSASPQALQELLAAAPKGARRPTGVDGGTRVGTDTGRSVGPVEPVPIAAHRESTRVGDVDLGTPVLAPEVASPAIERAGRAQLYWTLTQRCRSDDGGILPPEAITLHFTLDADGVVLPATAHAVPRAAQHSAAALCMLRELSTSKLRVPASSRGVETRVTATVPSVD